MPSADADRRLQRLGRPAEHGDAFEADGEAIPPGMKSSSPTSSVPILPSSDCSGLGGTILKLGTAEIGVSGVADISVRPEKISLGVRGIAGSPSAVILLRVERLWSAVALLDFLFCFSSAKVGRRRSSVFWYT